MDRRTFLATGIGAGVAALLPTRAAMARATRERQLVAAVGQAVIVDDAAMSKTEVWAYQGTVPGPEIRVKQGERLRVAVENRLPQETTVHWHGIRVPNAMDGVPHLTQEPIGNGESFVYEFDCEDAGTFWYHPHARSFEQVARGLHGVLIVEEREPIKVDRDIVWVLDDWRLTPDGQVSQDFGNMHDASHAGRLGNVVTINGRETDRFVVRAGERIRLRLVNVANARIFSLEFNGHKPQIVALDGQPVEPHAPANGRVLLGPAQRADLVLDCVGKPGERFSIYDRHYQRQQYRLVDLAYAPDAPLRESPLDASMRLSSNPIAEPDLANAIRHTIEFGGGMMDPKMMRSMQPGGGSGQGSPPAHMIHDMRDRMQRGMMWSINGVFAPRGEHVHTPFVTLDRGKTYVFDMVNDTAWWHPMHLHGHVFRVLSRNGEPAARREWLDTVLMTPGERTEIAFVADNPGDWMFHCHILEHQQAGMMGTVRVA